MIVFYMKAHYFTSSFLFERKRFKQTRKIQLFAFSERVAFNDVAQKYATSHYTHGSLRCPHVDTENNDYFIFIGIKILGLLFSISNIITTYLLMFVFSVERHLTFSRVASFK